MATPNERIVQSELDEPSPSPSIDSATALAQSYRNNNQWAHLMLPAIRSYCASAQIPHLGNRDELVAALQARGVQPINVLQNTPPGPSANPYAAELTANITETLLRRRADFPKQAQGEDFEVYLRRLEIAFSHDGTSNNTKIDCLIGHTTPTVAAAAQRLYDEGYHNYDDIAERLKIQFGLSPFEHFTRFLALRPLDDESWAQFGNRLRCEYIRYLPLSATDLPGQEKSITAALIGQLLAITTGGLHAHLYSKATADRTLTWVNCLAYADEYRRMHPNTPRASPAPQTQQQNNRRPKTTASGVQKHYCDHHQRYVLHTTAECSLGQNSRPNTATGNQSPRNLQSCNYHPGRLVAHSTAECRNNPANQVTRRQTARTRETPRSGSDGCPLLDPPSYRRQPHHNHRYQEQTRHSADRYWSHQVIHGDRRRSRSRADTPPDESEDLRSRLTHLRRHQPLGKYHILSWIMATDVAAEVGLTPHPTKAKISAAVLHISAEISHSVSTTFSLGSADYSATFFLLANARYPIILGLDTLKNLPFCVTLDGQRIFSGFQTIKPINEVPQADPGEGITFVNGSPAEQNAIANLLTTYKDNIFQWSGKHGLFPQHVASIPTNGQDPEPPRRICLSPDKIPAMTEILANYTKAGIIEPAQSTHTFVHRPGKTLTGPDALSRIQLNSIQLREVPDPGQRAEIMDQYHVEMGHTNWKKTFDTIRRRFTWPGMRTTQRFTWPGMRTDIFHHVLQCAKCFTFNSATAAVGTKLTPVPPADKHDRLGVDFWGPFPPSTKGNRYAIVAIDYYSRRVVTTPVKRATANALCSFLADVFAQMGTFEIIHSDGAAVFNSAPYKRFITANQIASHIAQPYHPEGNGACERAIKSLSAIIAKTASSPTTWDDVLLDAAIAYNRTPHTATGLPPIELWHQKPIPTPADIKFEIPSRDISQELKLVKAHQKQYRKRISTKPTGLNFASTLGRSKLRAPTTKPSL
ncbi:unnamed protein product [Notodromas monacha]|uniref:RNA-directed DNA polymerase n=1 Tax=Notodromas monacha TaxID=399045 RepID=A0A7R9BXU0_9CRUS|nr:unnamed protein product [Notodromas monacha]CAG0922810.1 unnamed protein product [Notodromas monacha]